MSSNLGGILQTKTGKIVAVCISVVLSDVLWWMYKKCKNFKSSKEVFHKIMFFDEQTGTKCYNHLHTPSMQCLEINCSVKHLGEILSQINSAKKSLDICVYFITYPVLTEALINAFRRDIKIRIISDFDMTKENCHQVITLKSAGLKLRSKKKDYLMHHKFMIVDNVILVNGSTNWTRQGFFGNFENLLITNQYELVQSFRAEFERLWVIMDT